MNGGANKQVDHNLKSFSVPALPRWANRLPLCLLLVLLACGRQPPPSPQISEHTPTLTPARQVEINPTRPVPTPSRQPASRIGIDAEEINGLLIQLWHPWSGQSGEAVEEAVSQFNASNPYGLRAEANYIGNYNSLNQRIRFASPEELPQLAVGYGYQIRDWQDSGIEVANLNIYQTDPEWGLTPDDWADFFPAFLPEDQGSGMITGFPAQRFAQVMIYNKTWAEELGFSFAPDTPVAFQEQACAAAVANSEDDDPANDRTGGWLINTSPPVMLSWFYSFGARVIAEGDEGYHLDSPETKTALEFLKDLFDAGCAWDSPETDPIAELAARRALLITTSIAELPLIQNALERAGSTDEWLALPFPTDQQDPVLAVYGPAFAILQSTPEKDLAAWLLIKWLATPEQQARLVSSSSSLIMRAATLEHLTNYAADNPQWATIQTHLDHALPEPALRSWETVRWVLSDVGTQVFRYYFTKERIPATLELMEETAAELHTRLQEEVPPP